MRLFYSEPEDYRESTKPTAKVEQGIERESPIIDEGSESVGVDDSEELSPYPVVDDPVDLSPYPVVDDPVDLSPYPEVHPPEELNWDGSMIDREALSSYVPLDLNLRAQTELEAGQSFAVSAKPGLALGERWGELRANIARTDTPRELARFHAPPSYAHVAGQVIEILQLIHDHPGSDTLTEQHVLAAERIYHSVAAGDTWEKLRRHVERALQLFADGEGQEAVAGMDSGQRLTFVYHILCRAGYVGGDAGGADWATQILDLCVQGEAPDPQLPDLGSAVLDGLRIGLDAKERFDAARARGDDDLKATCSALGDVFLRRVLKIGLFALAGCVGVALGGVVSFLVSMFAGQITDALTQPLEPGAPEVDAGYAAGEGAEW